VRIQGLSIHIGSQLLSLRPLEDAFLKLKKMRARVEAALGRRLEVLDLGGGVGIAYRAERPPSVAAYCNLIRKHFGPGSDQEPARILIEPGRSLSGNAGVLLTSVLFVKPRGKRNFLVVDAGMNDLARPALYSSHHEILPLTHSPRSRLASYDVVGPVCESTDCFGRLRRLPAKLQAGDLLALLSAGAYGFSMASNYNSRGRPAEVLVKDGQAVLIRERERPDELLRGEGQQPLRLD
jgi:diaminopimelate decarboxylase